MPEFREDPVTGRCVIIAPNRSARPHHHDKRSAGQYSPGCPFCAGNEAMTPPEIYAERESNGGANSSDWRVRVVPNRYPALENHGEWTATRFGLYQMATGFGVHEVIIESPGHVVDVGALDEGQFADVLRVYCARLCTLRETQRWRCLLIYKNQGEAAGATLEHVHSQLIGLPAVPKDVTDELRGAQRHFESRGHCVYCAIIESESDGGKRLVESTDRFVALCPFASRFAYETWILPKHHSPIFEHSSNAEIMDLARTLRAVIAKLNRALGNPSFNYFIHSLPPQQNEYLQYHWHIEILPQLTKAAGLEWASGVYLNSVNPEDAARRLREAVV